MLYLYTVEEIIGTFQRLERDELALTKSLEEKLRRMIYELQFRVDYCRLPPGYSSTGLQRVADKLEAGLAALRHDAEEGQ